VVTEHKTLCISVNVRIGVVVFAKANGREYQEVESSPMDRLVSDFHHSRDDAIADPSRRKAFDRLPTGCRQQFQKHKYSVAHPNPELRTARWHEKFARCLLKL
jgi:hypothetical protein